MCGTHFSAFPAQVQGPVCTRPAVLGHLGVHPVLFHLPPRLGLGRRACQSVLPRNSGHRPDTQGHRWAMACLQEEPEATMGSGASRESQLWAWDPLVAAAYFRGL